MRTLTATFPTLSRALSSNQKSRWLKTEASKEARHEAFLQGLKERVSRKGGNGVLYFNKAKVSLTLYADTKLARARKCYVPEDVQNLIAAVKPHIDGLKDAGWVKDDDKRCIVGFDPVNIITGKEAGGKCELVITFTEVEG